MASNSINILLKARDQASPAINKAAKSSDHLKTSMKGTSSAGAGLGGGMKGMVGPLLLVAGGFLAAKAAAAVAKAAFRAFTSFLSTSIENWAVQEEAIRGNSPALQEYASNLQALTNIGDEEILNQMQVARGMGVTDDRMKQVTQTAIALSEVTGKSLKKSMKAAVNGTEGYLDALIETFPAMRNMETQAEKQAFVQQKLKDGYAMATQGTDTLKGALKSLGNNWGDMLEKVGELLAPTIKKIADWFNRIAPVVQKLIGKLLPMFQTLAMKIQEWAAWMGEKLVYAFTFVQVVAANWKEALQAYLLKVVANFITMVERVKYFFTDAIPTVLKWFAENFLNIFRDMFVAYITMWENRIKQIIDLFTLFWDTISGKLSAGDALLKAGEIAGRSMLEGFEATTKPLPKIWERQMTEAEKAAHAAAGKTWGGVMDKVDVKFNERMKGWKDTFSMELGGDAGDWLGLDLSNLAGDKEKEKKKKKDSKIQALTATEGRFLSRARQNPMIEKQEKLIAQGEKNMGILKDQFDTLEDMNKHLDQMRQAAETKESPIENTIPT